MGFLTGAITLSTTFDPTDDLRDSAGFPRPTKEAIAHNRFIVDLLARVGHRKKAMPGQVALAWLLARKPWIVPIPGTSKINHMQENLGAANIEMTKEDREELEAGFAAIAIQGKRAPEELIAVHDIGVNIGTNSAGTHGNSPLRQTR
jgi:aryl-alcohol dehydrogenase-like predicted oxidoreductase